MALRKFAVCLIDDVSDKPRRELKRPAPHTAGAAQAFSSQNSGPESLRSREITLPPGSVVGAVELGVRFRPLPAAPGTQDVLDGATVTPGRHVPPTDSSCAVCLLGTSRTQPPLGDHQGREGKKGMYACYIFVLFCCGVLFVYLFGPVALD